MHVGWQRKAVVRTGIHPVPKGYSAGFTGILFAKGGVTRAVSFVFLRTPYADDQSLLLLTMEYHCTCHCGMQGFSLN